MLPNDSIEIIDKNNNEGQSSETPGIEDHTSRRVELFRGYQVTDQLNYREIKCLLVENNVTTKIITLDVPFLCTEMDLLETIFPSCEVFQDELGFKIVQDETERRVEMIKGNDPYEQHYRVNLHPPTVIVKPMIIFEDCHVIEQIENVLPLENPPQCSPPESIDSQATYFEPAEMKADSPEDDEFFSCLNEENDIILNKNDNSKSRFFKENETDVKKNSENCKSLEVINIDQDSLRENDKESKAERVNEKNSHEIEPSKFYSSLNYWKANSSPNGSCNTVQLSDSPILSQPKSQRSKSSINTILAIYPPHPERGGITIYKENYKCLGDSEYLNDVIIDFYLKYLTYEVLSKEDRNRTHVFSSQFFTRLSKPAIANDEADVLIPESERRHIGVQRWTKNVNIFEKDFVIIPINEHYHWNLAIICYPGLVGTINIEDDSLIKPCILFFDSLLNKSKDRTAGILRGYLSQEYFAKTRKEKSFSKASLKVIYPRVPKQSNATDCGLYVLQYVEQFFKYPIMDFNTPIDLSQWFKRSVIRKKRAEIAGLIADLAKNYNPHGNVSIPVLEFPSDILTSDEEDLISASTKMKHPLYTGNYPSFTTSSKIFGGAESCSSTVSGPIKDDQSSLGKWIDGVRDVPSSEEQLNLSLDFKAPEKQTNENHCFLNTEDDDVLIEEDNIDVADKSLELISDFQSDNSSSFTLKTLNHTYSHKHKIGLIKENFSGTKSHIFKKTSIFSDEADRPSSSGSRPKRDCRTKRKSAKMVELTLKYHERKKKNQLKMDNSEGQSTKKSSNWIDDSVFKVTDSFYNPFSEYTANSETGISPSISYSKFKIQKKFEDKYNQY